LIEVVRRGILGDLVVCLPTEVPDAERGLGRPAGGMDGRGRSGLTDMGEDLGNRLRISQGRDEREGRLAGRTDEGEDFAINASRRCLRARRVAHREGREGVGSGAFRFALSVWGDGTLEEAGGRTSRPET